MKTLRIIVLSLLMSMLIYMVSSFIMEVFTYMRAVKDPLSCPIPPKTIVYIKPWDIPAYVYQATDPISCRKYRVLYKDDTGVIHEEVLDTSQFTLFPPYVPKGE